MKKIISLFLALITLTSVFAVSATAYAAKKQAKTEIYFEVVNSSQSYRGSCINVVKDTYSYRWATMKNTDGVEYSGKSAKPTIIFKNKDGKTISLKKKFYKVKAKKYKKIGKYSVKVTLTTAGKKKYTLKGKTSMKKYYYVRPASLYNANVSYDASNNKLIVEFKKNKGATHTEVVCNEHDDRKKDTVITNTYTSKENKIEIPLKVPAPYKVGDDTTLRITAYTVKNGQKIYSCESLSCFLNIYSLSDKMFYAAKQEAIKINSANDEFLCINFFAPKDAVFETCINTGAISVYAERLSGDAVLLPKEKVIIKYISVMVNGEKTLLVGAFYGRHERILSAKYIQENPPYLPS